MTRATVAAAFLFATGGLACSGDTTEPVPTACDEEVPPAGPGLIDADFVGFVRVTDNHSLIPADDGSPRDVRTGRVQAGFGDFRAATSTAAQLLLLGPVCVGVTSRSQSAGRVSVSAGALSLQHGGGTIEVTETSTGVYVYTGEQLLGADVTVQATGDGFPAFTTMPPSPMSLDNLVFEPNEISVDGMMVTWTPGTARRVRLTLAPPPGASNSGGQVVCEVVDDGCFALPAAASSFVLSNNELEYRVTVERVNDETQMLNVGAASAALQTEAVQRREMVLKNGVFE